MAVRNLNSEVAAPAARAECAAIDTGVVFVALDKEKLFGGVLDCSGTIFWQNGSSASATPHGTTAGDAVVATMGSKHIGYVTFQVVYPGRFPSLEHFEEVAAHFSDDLPGLGRRVFSLPLPDEVDPDGESRNSFTNSKALRYHSSLSVADEVGEPRPFLYIGTIDLEPEARGKSLGLQSIVQILKIWGRDCCAVFLSPQPSGNFDDAAYIAAQERLSAHYGKMGFAHLESTADASANDDDEGAYMMKLTATLSDQEA